MERVPVFFSSLMVTDSGSFSPSARKPESVVAAWCNERLPIDVIEPQPVTVEELSLVHDRRHVEDVLACLSPNGFGNRSPDVACTLVHTSGAMVSAAMEALRNGRVAVAPCSGFHHAGPYTTEGYCTFNGLMVTAAILLQVGLAKRVGILDCDQHYGNGTDDIIERLRNVGSLGPDDVVHATAGATFGSKDRAAQESREFLEAWLPRALKQMSTCDVVLYQAGADPHVDDPLGGFLTTEQLCQRDEIVFRELASYLVPVAWNLAGGYQVEPDGSIPKVLEVHSNTMRECIKVHCSGAPR